MAMIVCKPDALHGVHAAVDGERAAALLNALAAFVATPRLTLVAAESWQAAASRAASQVMERAVSEPGFRGRVVDAAGTAVRLRHAAAQFGAGPADTAAAVRAAVEALGFRITDTRRVLLGVEGVDVVYGQATTTVQFDQVRADLYAYLAEDPVELWALQGEQAPCTLQWWKTFVRHILLDRQPGRYLLRNLVHVCDGPDEEYLEARLRQP